MLSYYNATRLLSQPVLDDINTTQSNRKCIDSIDVDVEVATNLSLVDSPEGAHEFSDNIKDRTINALQECADLYIPRHKKGYYKFW